MLIDNTQMKRYFTEETTLIDKRVLLSWFQEEVKGYGIRVHDFGRSFRNGLVLCSIIHRYNPEIM